MGPIIPSTETQESCQISPCRLCAVPQAQHPRFRPSHASPPLLCHDQAAQLTTHTHSTRNLSPKSHRWRLRPRSLSTGRPQLLCFSDLHLSDCQVASPPITPAQWMRRDTFHVQSSLRRLCPSLPCPQSLWDLVSAFSPRRNMAQPVLLRALFLVTASTLFLRPTNHCHRVLSAPILLPPVFLITFWCACLSTLRWSFFAATLCVVPSTLLLTIPHTRVWRCLTWKETNGTRGWLLISLAWTNLQRSS